MRHALLLGSFVCLAAVAPLTAAPPAPEYLAVVTADAEVRSGPSSESRAFHVTNRLKRGATVEVMTTRNDGWLAIRPPADSFSWIREPAVQYLNNDRMVCFVKEDKAEVRLGSTEPGVGEPTVMGTPLAKGTQLVAVGPAKVGSQGVAWLPIQPPPSEVRYLHASVVSRAGTGEAVAAQSGAPAPVAGVDPRWLRAEQQVMAGNFAEARRQYKELHDAVLRTNHDLAMWCLNRIQWLESTGRVPPTVAAMSPPAAEPRPQPQGQTMSGYPLPAAAPAPSAPAAAVPPTDPQTGTPSSRQGRLRVAGCWLEARPTYALVDRHGQIVTYVTAEPGLDLRPFVNQTVELWGAMAYRGDLRHNYMAAYQVKPLTVGP